MRQLLVRDLQNQIAEALSSLPGQALPPELEGLRHIPVGGHRPIVSVFYKARPGKERRDVRDTAAATYFDPDSCELVISFEPLADVDDGYTAETGSATRETERTVRKYDLEQAMDQLVGELQKAQLRRTFVGLTWFRDQFLVTDCEFEWVKDPETVNELLDKAIKQQLFLTSKVFNPNSHLHPTTALQLNASHPRLRPGSPDNGSRFRPVSIRGEMISDTVIRDRD